MKLYTKNGLAYFFDRSLRQWTLYPIDKDGNRIEWDSNDNPIEVKYFNNKTEVNNYTNGKFI